MMLGQGFSTRSLTTAHLLIVFLLGPWNSLRAAEEAEEPSKPNIVFIYADDLGYGDVQCYNPERGKIATPNIDRLATQGMRFTDAHSSSGVCTPSRYALLTGRYAWRTRLQSGVFDGGNEDPLIALDRLTVASLLKQQGYATACIGKWHLGFQSDKSITKHQNVRADAGSGLPIGAKIIRGPTTNGFDEFYGCSNARTMSSLIENDKVIEIIKPIEMLPRISERAVDYIQAQATSSEPFFLYLPLTAPHTPIVPSAEWQRKSRLGAYGDFVMQTDAVVGDVLTALDAAGCAANTIVFFSSDNGCSPAAKVAKLEAQGHYPSANLRGYKADAWEGGHRVPFIVRWPGVVKPESVCDQLILQADLMGTVADLFAMTLPNNAGEDSFSMLPLLKGTNKVIRENAVNTSIRGVPALRVGSWKYIAAPGSGGWGKGGDTSQAVQLYDLALDITEMKNLASEKPEKVREMQGLLERLIADGRSTAGAKQNNDVEVRRFP
jgi:arylsulfatase A-like enzyme